MGGFPIVPQPEKKENHWGYFTLINHSQYKHITWRVSSKSFLPPDQWPCQLPAKPQDLFSGFSCTMVAVLLALLRGGRREELPVGFSPFA